MASLSLGSLTSLPPRPLGSTASATVWSLGAQWEAHGAARTAAGLRRASGSGRQLGPGQTEGAAELVACTYVAAGICVVAGPVADTLTVMASRSGSKGWTPLQTRWQLRSPGCWCALLCLHTPRGLHTPPRRAHSPLRAHPRLRAHPPEARTPQWRPGMGAGLGARRCTAGGAGYRWARRCQPEGIPARGRAGAQLTSSCRALAVRVLSSCSLSPMLVCCSGAHEGRQAAGVQVRSWRGWYPVWARGWGSAMGAGLLSCTRAAAEAPAACGRGSGLWWVGRGSGAGVLHL